jgi:hypothetical protein
MIDWLIVCPMRDLPGVLVIVQPFISPPLEDPPTLGDLKRAARCDPTASIAEKRRPFCCSRVRRRPTAGCRVGPDQPDVGCPAC